MHIFTVFALSFGVCLCAMLPMKHTAKALGAIDLPSEKRKLHSSPTARAGGVAIFFSVLVALLFSFVEYDLSVSRLATVLLSGGALIVAIGLCDDVFSMPALTKLVSQGTVCIIPIAFNYRITSVSLGTLSLALPSFMSVAITLLWILSLVNAMNFIDGLDGLCGGFSFFASLSLFLINTPQKEELSLFCIALCGAALGFLPYNKHRASIFMGDSGSLFFGYSLAVLSIVSFEDGARSGTAFPILAAVLIFAFPLGDLIFAIFRRLYQRKSIFSADAEHFHHRLLKRGLSHTQSVNFLLLFTLFCDLVAVFLILLS